MIAPDVTDAESFARTLTVLANLMPAMAEPARRRAAWSVARGKANLAAAVAAEGFRLDAPAPAPAALAPAPADDIAILRHAAALAVAAHLEGRGSKAAAEAAKNAASARIDRAARALQKRSPNLSYQAAVEAVTR